MTNFQESKQLFEKMGLVIRVIGGEHLDWIEVIDSEGEKADFCFTKDGNLSKTGYYGSED